MSKAIKNEFPWGTLEWLANAEVGNSRELSLARMMLPPGKVTEVHRHANCEEAIYVVHGVVECAAGESRRRIAAGEQAVVERGTAHSIRNVGTGNAQIILSYSSAAREFELA